MKKRTYRSYLYLLPSLLVIGIIVVFPILYTGYISVTNMNVYHWFNPRIIGFQNYAKAFAVLDSGFLTALLRTIVWTVLNMVLQMVIAYVIAVLLNTKGLRAHKIYKTILMFPWAMPGYVSILLWKMGMFNNEYGLMNQFLHLLGKSGINWLNGDVTAFLSCTLVNLWLALPFMIMIIDGALQSIDKAYYESAILDGAGFFTKLQKITIPLVRPVIAPAVVITIFTTFKQFDIIYLLTQQQGAKTGADIHTVITYTYEKAFVTNNYGYSSAISIIIFAILIISSILTNRQLKEGNV
ncbi:carbohydrate ABC transporter permease [Caproicibacterium amylolyticum]|uniref:Sugar ABC transporter permease n=1 Tax=Caproicibacterium amylolyticum TaxID=2766537 RepID=A0A7G9WGM6_9FIRM|nr:sugar ABC transporter permease [Caproicibacterium amylolyticum]QNO17838.1 sugar ABC transporter permease [Caproicibacterium amylolyticum]